MMYGFGRSADVKRSVIEKWRYLGGHDCLLYDTAQEWCWHEDGLKPLTAPHSPLFHSSNMARLAKFNKVKTANLATFIKSKTANLATILSIVYSFLLCYTV